MKILSAIIVLIFSLIFSIDKLYLTRKTTQIIIVFDASNSMAEKIGEKTRMEIAKDALLKIINKLYSGRSNILTGLRVYGHIDNQCNNSELVLPLEKIDKNKLKFIIQGLKPIGRTPIAFSLEKSETDFRHDIPGDKHIILVTDGVENCFGSPCDVSREIKKRGKINKIHVIALSMQAREINALKCIPEPSNGFIVSSNNPDDLYNNFYRIIAQINGTNLIISAKDDNGDTINVGIEIFQDNQKILTSGGKNIELSLTNGKYDIKAFNPKNNQVIWITGVKLIPDDILSKEILFSEGQIQFVFTDNKGKDVYVEYEIKPLNSDFIVARGRSSGILNKTLNPGEYMATITDWETKISKTIEFKVDKNQKVKKNIVFKRASLKINFINFLDMPLDYISEVFLSNSNFRVSTFIGNGKHEYVLLPKKYDIKITYSRTGFSIWMRNVNIANGDNLSGEVVLLSDGRLYIRREISQVTQESHVWNRNTYRFIQR